LALDPLDSAPTPILGQTLGPAPAECRMPGVTPRPIRSAAVDLADLQELPRPVDPRTPPAPSNAGVLQQRTAEADLVVPHVQQEVDQQTCQTTDDFYRPIKSGKWIGMDDSDEDRSSSRVYVFVFITS